MVRPKKFSLDLDQHTLEETWFFQSKTRNRESNIESSSSNLAKKINGSHLKIVKTPTKSILKSMVSEPKASTSITENNHLFDNKENESDDSDIIQSSQDKRVSKFREKINQTLSKKHCSFKSTPKERLSIENNGVNLNILSNLSPSIVKEEISETYIDSEPIEMIHDLSNTINESIFQNIPPFSSTMLNSQMDINSISGQSLDEELEDPLHIDDSFEKKHIYILSAEDITKLKLLKIKLQHKVPPQHKIENRAGTHSLTKKQIQIFQKYGPLKQGPYALKEDKIIKNNWTNFCKIHDWDEEMPEPFLYFRQQQFFYIPSFEERKNFVKFLANGLPWRSLHSVYYRFKILYRNCNNGRFTPQEDKIIISHMKKIPSNSDENHCSILGNILKRPRHSIWRRYQRLKRHMQLKNDTDNSDTSIKNHKTYENKDIPFYDLSFIQTFIETLMKLTLCKDVKELKDHIILKCIWKKVAEALEFNEDALKSFWYKQVHLQLFCPGPIYDADVKIKLIEYMYVKGIRHKSEINWKKVATCFDGMTTEFLYKTFSILINIARRSKYSKFIDQISYLYEKYIPHIITKPHDKLLPRLKFIEGKFTHNEEDIQQHEIKIENENY